MRNINKYNLIGSSDIFNIEISIFFLRSKNQRIRLFIFRDDPEKIDLGDLFDEPPITDTKEFLKHLLLDFYERSSIDDLPIRRLWSSNIFSKNELEEFGRTNECLAKKVENSKLLFESGSDVPLYLIERSTLANNLSIKLYFQLMILDSQSESRNVGDDEDVIRLKEYSSAVSSGEFKKKNK